MKKYLILPGLTAVVIISMSFIIIGPKKINKQNTFSIKKPTCDCPTPTGLTAVRVGNSTTVTWNGVTGGVTYSIGGYRSCGEPVGFGACTPNHSVVVQSNNCFITVRVVANCDGTTSCTGITCSSLPSQPVQSN